MPSVKGLLTTGVVYLRSLAAGGGTASFIPSGAITTNITQAATIADTNETDLWTFSLPAGSLNTNGQSLRITAYGTVGANTNTKTVRLYFGGTAIAFRANNPNAAGWKLEAVVTRMTATTQYAYGLGYMVGTVQDLVSTPGETLANAITIKMTGQNGTANANDIVFRGAFVEFIS